MVLVLILLRCAPSFNRNFCEPLPLVAVALRRSLARHFVSEISENGPGTGAMTLSPGLGGILLPV